MRGVHHELSRVDDGLERAARFDMNFMCESVLLIGCLVGHAAVIALARDLLYRLVETASERDVGFLETTADRKERNPTRQGPRHQRQHPRVTVAVQRQAGVMHLFAEMAG